MKELMKRKRIGFIAMSVVFSLILCLISLIYKEHYLSNLARTPFLYALFILLCAIVIYFIGYGINVLAHAKPYSENTCFKFVDNKAFNGVYFVVITIIYLVCFGTYYPGISAYDYKTSYQQAMGIQPLSNHHPVFYTFIWKVFQVMAGMLGKEYYADVLYAVAQIIIVIITYWVILKWMRKRNFSPIWRVATMLYFFLMPNLQLFAFSPTKDVPFACSLIIFLMSFVDYIDGKSGLRACIICSVFACLLRHNMVYIMIVLAVILVIKRKEYKKVIIGLFPALLVAFIISKVLVPAIGVKSTESAEYLCVPMQQIAALYSFEAYFTEEEREKIVEYIPDVKKYNYRFVDPIKDNFNNELYRNDSLTFWKLYFSGLKQNPMIYFCAFFDTNSPLLYPGSDVMDPYNGRKYIELGQNSGAEEFRISRMFSSLKPFYDSVGDGRLLIMSFPIAKLYFSLSFPFYSLIIAVVALWNRKDEKNYGIIICTVFLLLLGTYLLGPVTNYRYCYPMYLACPLYLGSAFATRSGNNEDVQ